MQLTLMPSHLKFVADSSRIIDFTMKKNAFDFNAFSFEICSG
jgi:hypothetical protein